MNHLFVPYELALKLKEKGFNEQCLAAYVYVTNSNNNIGLRGCGAIWFTVDGIYQNSLYEDEIICTAPLYQQVIDWLDSKNIHISIHPEFYKDGINWNWQVFEYDPNGKKDPISSRYSYTTNRSTMLYGDNGEYPKRMDAVKAAIEEALKLI